MKNSILYVALALAFSSCRLPAYVVYEYFDLPDGLNKKEFKHQVAERNGKISKELGYVKLFDLVKVSPQDKRNKLFLERELFENSFVLPKDSVLISENLKQLISINHRLKVWPSVYEKVYGNKLNPHYWTVWMKIADQQLVRDSIDRATFPILAASQYRMEPSYFFVYKEAMRLKKIQQARLK